LEGLFLPRKQKCWSNALANRTKYWGRRAKTQQGPRGRRKFKNEVKKPEMETSSSPLRRENLIGEMVEESRTSNISAGQREGKVNKQKNWGLWTLDDREKKSLRVLVRRAEAKEGEGGGVRKGGKKEKKNWVKTSRTFEKEKTRLARAGPGKKKTQGNKPSPFREQAWGKRGGEILRTRECKMVKSISKKRMGGRVPEQSIR